MSSMLQSKQILNVEKREDRYQIGTFDRYPEFRGWKTNYLALAEVPSSSSLLRWLFKLQLVVKSERQKYCLHTPIQEFISHFFFFLTQKALHDKTKCSYHEINKAAKLKFNTSALGLYNRIIPVSLFP